MIKTALALIYNLAMVIRLGKPRHARFMSAQESIDTLARSSRSLIRIGDGEFVIINNHDIHFQKADPALAEVMHRMIEDYEAGRSDYYLAMPSKYFTCPWTFYVKHWSKMKYWVYPRRVFMQRYDRDVTYLDAFMFSGNYRGAYEKVWEASPAAGFILVHNDARYAESLQQSTGRPVDFVGIPPRDAYSRFDELVERIKALYRPDRLVLISAGPCGKALVYRLSEMGMRCIDTGHCFDEPLEVIQG